MNPARSLGPALFAGWDADPAALGVLIFPVVGGLIAGATYNMLFGTGPTVPLEETTQA